MTITVISGAPGSGKSTYVQENAQPGDIIIDMDLIASSLWVPTVTDVHAYPNHVREVARAARNAATNQAIKISHVSSRVNVWIIQTKLTKDLERAYRLSGARFVELDPGKYTCIERVQKRQSPRVREMIDVIHNWYSEK